MQLLMQTLRGHNNEASARHLQGWAATLYSISDFLLWSFVAIWAHESFEDLTVARASKSGPMKKV